MKHWLPHTKTRFSQMNIIKMTIELQFPEFKHLLTSTNRNKNEIQEVEK